MSLPRRVEPEWLDELPQADPRSGPVAPGS